MARIPNIDRKLIFNTVNQDSHLFTKYEVKQIHEVAFKLYEIHMYMQRVRKYMSFAKLK